MKEEERSGERRRGVRTDLDGGGLLLVGGEDLARLLRLDCEDEGEEGAEDEVEGGGAHWALAV